MAIYTVHEPPSRIGAAAPDPERYVFVRDGFSFWALIFGPLWMLRHRMWLVLLLYIVVSLVLDAAIRFAGASVFVVGGVGLLLSLLIGPVRIALTIGHSVATSVSATNACPP